MSTKDTVTKEYMGDNATFADAFNFYIYNGEQIIKPEKLRAIDTTEIALPYGAKNEVVPIQKLRDVTKIAMADENAAYLLLGIENQSDIHQAMPVRNMLYDAIQYSAQVSDIAKSHKKEKDKANTNAEYLSGFYRTDKLLPVITLTIYFGADKWDAPKSIYDMLSIKDKNILKFVPNYRINLITPADIEDKDFSKFHTELSLALKYIKYSKDKNKLMNLIETDKAYRSVSKRTADMVSIITNSNLKYPTQKERIDMCEAIEGIKNDALNEGVAKGIIQGKNEGIAEGIVKGKNEGKFETLASLVKDGIITIEEAAKRSDLTVEEFRNKLNR